MSAVLQDQVRLAAAANADDADDWPEPVPLMEQGTSEPYPLDALPAGLADAITEVQAYVQAPIALVACSALTTLSTAVQAHVDVKRADRLLGPTGVYALVVADSGERKTTCDNFFTKPIRAWETAQQERFQPVIEAHRADADAWEAKRAAILENIRAGKKKGSDTGKLEAELREHQTEQPEPPRVPRLIYGDTTPEALAFGLVRQWPAGAVLSSEAGIVFGSHGMGRESSMRNFALLNVLWDGGELSVERRTSESFTVRGARLTVGLAVQEATVREFLERSAGLARGTGFFARFLFAWPESTQGTRMYREASGDWPALARFHARIEAILNQKAPVGEDGTLCPAMLSLDAQAQEAWVRFHDAIEAKLRPSGELHDVRDVASKAADNAARLAALFSAFEEPGTAEISAALMNAAARIVTWHLTEAQRFFGGLAVPQSTVDAMRLQDWLVERCRADGVGCIHARTVQQFATPVRLRKREVLDAAIAELSEAERVRDVLDGRRRVLVINPAVLDGEAP